MGKEGEGGPCLCSRRMRCRVPPGWDENWPTDNLLCVLTLRPFSLHPTELGTRRHPPTPPNTHYTMLTCIRSPLPTRLGARAPAPSTASVRGTPLRGPRVTNGARVCAFFNFKKLRGNAEDAGK